MLMDISTLRAATGDFADSNKLGEGGFGAVYKVPKLPAYILEILHVAEQQNLHLAQHGGPAGYSARRRRDRGEETVQELNTRSGGAQERAGPGGEAQAQESRQACGRLPGTAGAAARLRVRPQPEPRPDPIYR